MNSTIFATVYRIFVREWSRYFIQENTKRKRVLRHVSVGENFEPNISISILGNPFLLEHQLSLQSKVMKECDKIVVHGVLSVFDRDIRLWLREYTKVKSHEISQVYAQKLGVNFNKIFIKDMKTRWGSCSSKGNLNYNWRLILAPEDVFLYLCAHEVSHLKHPHHQSSFWETVGFLHPNYQQARQWLKTNGHSLWKYG